MTSKPTQQRFPTLIKLALVWTAMAGSLLVPAQVLGQSVSATLRGRVNAVTPAGGATITVTNSQTGFSRSVNAGEDGSYRVGGLPPGTYEVDLNTGEQHVTQVVILQVGQTATLDLDASEPVPSADATIDSVVVTATHLYETRTSEVASYVSPKQIEMLPQNSRNFLAFADTIAGVQFATAGNDGSTELRSGAQAANGVNVFIDGVGQKNYVLRGGVSGQSTSRGNPFPQLGISEYKVITSNYKAEFDQLSSAAIVAVTRSGTNEFEAEGFWDKTSENWRAADPLEAAAGRKSESKQEQYGAAFGGPIIADRMHFFLTYESKQFESPRVISFGEGVSPLDPGAAPFLTYLGPTSSPFEEDLFFGKIDWSIGDFHLVEFTAKVRDENEIYEIGDRNTASYAAIKDNTETRLDLRYQYSAASFLNDVHITYEDAQFNPRPVTLGPGIQLTTSDPNKIVLNLGGGQNYQDRGQAGYALQDDLTFTAFDFNGTHTLKTGLKYKQIEINSFEQQPYNPQFAYDVTSIAASAPFQVKFGAVLPGFPDRNVTSRNKQFGIYLQDDWEVNERLLLNMGLRWDYEETPGFLDYVTPADVVAGLNAIDPKADPALNQTYVQTLALGGIDVNDYISTGNNRAAFTGAIQPRVGFSYALEGDQRHVIFGGAGRAYDRNVFNYLALEQSKGTFPTYTRKFNVTGHACTPGEGDCLAWDEAYFDRANLEALVASNPSLGREVNLINNDLKTPYSDQFSLGMRNRVMLGNHAWNTSAALTYVESNDGIVFLLGNRYPDGSFRPAGTIWGNQPWSNGIPGLGTLIIAKNGLKTRATSLLLQADKPYSRESPWSVTLAYTYTNGKENRSNVGKNDEHYMLDYAEVSGFGWHASTGVPRHRLVSTGIVEIPWDISLSAKLTLSSPVPVESVNCFNAIDDKHCYFQNFEPSTTIGYRQFDLALQKTLETWNDVELRARTDVLNVFNSDNVDNYDTWRGDPQVRNGNFGDPVSYFQPTRTFKLSFGLKWR